MKNKKLANKRRNARKKLGKIYKRVNKSVKSTRTLSPGKVRKLDLVQYKDPAKIDAQHKLGKVLHIFHSGNYAYVKWDGSGKMWREKLEDLKVIKRKGRGKKA